MPLTTEQRRSLLSVKGVGPIVLQRLQQMGLDDVSKLATADVAEILAQGAILSGSRCWQNSPQAKAAISAAVAWAQQYGAATAPLVHKDMENDHPD